MKLEALRNIKHRRAQISTNAGDAAKFLLL